MIAIACIWLISQWKYMLESIWKMAGLYARDVLVLGVIFIARVYNNHFGYVVSLDYHIYHYSHLKHCSFLEMSLRILIDLLAKSLIFITWPTMKPCRMFRTLRLIVLVLFGAEERAPRLVYIMRYIGLWIYTSESIWKIVCAWFRYVISLDYHAYSYSHLKHCSVLDISLRMLDSSCHEPPFYYTLNSETLQGVSRFTTSSSCGVMCWG